MTATPSADQAFPNTRKTWLCAQLERGQTGKAEALQHVMAIYRQPLGVYLRGSSFRWLGETDDVVQAFFADRLSRPEFLPRWQSSRRPLRYWLIVAFKHFLLEESARRKRLKRQRDFDGQNAAVSLDDGPAEGFDRACALALVHDALTRGEALCRADGLSEHWAVFLEHHLHGRPLAQVAGPRGLTPRRVAVMARTASARFRQEMRALVAWDGANEDEIDAELRALMGSLR